MCGIAGIYNYKVQGDIVDQNLLRAIRDHMSSRGPDGAGEWLCDKGRMGLAHRRLSIVDLSERGRQPMHSSCGRYVVTYNGEIYNYPQLRAQLEAQGRCFVSDADTEVLLHLYELHGRNMMRLLRGMYAFGIWDNERQGLLLARDPYGIKPLYYVNDGQSVSFASQVKALGETGAASAEYDLAGLAGFLLFGAVPEPFTIYRDIQCLPAGSSLWIDEHGLDSPLQFQNLAELYVPVADEDATADVAPALLDSVKHHLMADVPVGAFLSSGVDSGALVGLMRDAGQRDIKTMTLAFEEFRGTQQDETPLAAKVAKQYETDHHVKVVTQTELQQSLAQFLKDMDQPSVDGLNTWLISKAANEIGLKVALSGLGGDELFGGYPSFRDLPRWTKLFGLPAQIPGLGPATRRLGEVILSAAGSLVSVSPKAPGMLEYGANLAGAYLLRRGIFMPWELPKILGRDAAEVALARLRPLELIKRTYCVDGGGLKSNYASISAMESALYMRNQLLRDSDWAGMAHSLEIRVPMVDTELLRRLGPALQQKRTSTGKRLVGTSPKQPLPESVINRSKTGFSIPMSNWKSAFGLERFEPPRNLNVDAHWSRQWTYAQYRHLVV